MEFSVTKANDSLATVYGDDRPLAVFRINPHQQIDLVALAPNLSEADKTLVLTLFTSYVRGRIDPMSNPAMLDVLKAAYVEVVDVATLKLGTAIEQALASPGLRDVDISFELGHGFGYDQLQSVTFRVKPPHQFRLWHSLSSPGGGLDLDVVPGYHPVMTGRESVVLVNGDTDAVICGQAIRSVKAPPASLYHSRSSSFLWSTWPYVNHPFYAAGNEIVLDMSQVTSLTPAGIEEIRVFVAGMLELQNSYIAISGGFRGPYEHPDNVRSKAGLRVGSYGGKARGSEGRCVWAVEVLQREGALSQAYVPSWFYTEGWQDAYQRFGAKHDDPWDSLYG
jgi:hypothetical protein